MVLGLFLGMFFILMFCVIDEKHRLTINVGFCLRMSTLNLLHILAAVNNLGTTTLLP